jgi:hypothetical protein
MILLAISIQTLAFYCLYNTSQRATLTKDVFSVWLQGHTRFCQIAGLVLLAVSFGLLIIAQGFGTGVFISFLSLMTCGSLIILFIPLKSNNN